MKPINVINKLNESNLKEGSKYTNICPSWDSIQDFGSGTNDDVLDSIEALVEYLEDFYDTANTNSFEYQGANLSELDVARNLSHQLLIKFKAAIGIDEE